MLEVAPEPLEDKKTIERGKTITFNLFKIEKGTPKLFIHSSMMYTACTVLVIQVVQFIFSNTISCLYIVTAVGRDRTLLRHNRQVLSLISFDTQCVEKAKVIETTGCVHHRCCKQRINPTYNSTILTDTWIGLFNVDYVEQISVVHLRIPGPQILKSTVNTTSTDQDKSQNVQST